MFKNFLTKILSKTKKIVSNKKFWALTLVASFLLMVGQVAGAQAAAPQFNVFTGEQDFFKAGWQSGSQTIDFTDPLSVPNAKDGDLVKFRVYFHNAPEGTIAIDTKVRAEIPTTFAKSHTATAYLSAIGVSTVADQVKIENLPANFRLDYVPGSTKLWTLSNVANPDNFDKVTSLPDGVVSANGVNIGNIQGCWEYRGFVTFQTKLVAQPTGNPQLNIKKYVSKDGQNWLNFSQDNKTLQANLGDTLQYKVLVWNSGQADANQVKISDNFTDTSHLNNISSFDENFGTVSATTNSSQNTAVAHTFSAKINNSGFPIGATEIYNTAKIVSNQQDVNLGLSSTAKAIITVTQPGQPNVVLSKSAHNETQNANATSVKAHAGDIITYTLSLNNTGNASAESYPIADDMSDVLEYADVMLYNGSTLSNGTITFPSANIQPGQIVNKTFKVQVKNPLPETAQNGYHFDMVMYNFFGNSVAIYLERLAPQPAEIRFDKFVRNVNRNESSFVKENIANPGDILEYKIWFKNEGEGTAYDVSIFDVPASSTVLIPGSIILHKGADQIPLENITNDWVNIGNIAAGQSGYITIKVTTSTMLAHNAVLINKAYLKIDGLNPIEAQASTTIEVPEIKGKPITPPVTPPTIVSPAGPVPKALPPTGGAGVISSLMLLITSTCGFIYARKREKLAEINLA